ncbi:MAG: phosphodiester glycosidase family protein [Anaerolineae bacterium]|nr:phosphodiester glycosidase family protein [Anaerolineae bacterium]
MLKILRKTLTGVLIVFLILVAVVGAYLFWYTHRPLPAAVTDRPIFQSITYSRLIRSEPRPLVIHVVRVGLDAPGIGFLVTPPDNVDGYQYRARTVSQFLDDFDVQVAINADGFEPWWEYGPFNYYPHDGDGTNAVGLTVSQGRVVKDGTPEHASLFISEDNRVSFTPPAENFYNVVSAMHTLMVDGVYLNNVTNAYMHDLHPRTAVALSQDERTFIIVVVDGRQPNYSEGVSLPELAAIVAEQGGYTALNMDGGGSSALVMQGADGRPLQLGSAIHTRIPGRERPVANHLGVFARPLES